MQDRAQQQQKPTLEEQNRFSNVDSDDNNNARSVESNQTQQTTKTAEVMGDTRSAEFAVAAGAISADQTVAGTRTSSAMRGGFIDVQQRGPPLRREMQAVAPDGIYPYLPPAHTQPPCAQTTPIGPPIPAGRIQSSLPCGNRYTHDGFRASCGRYNYGAGHASGACGGCAGYATGFGEATYGCEVAKTACGGPNGCPPNEFFYDGWTEIGTATNTDCYPVTDYLTKSCTRCDTDPFLRCQYGECTGCRAQANPLDKGYNGEGGCGGDYLPLPSTMNLENHFHHQRRASAFENPTMFTNSGIGIGPFGAPLGGPRCGTRKNSQLGWNYGTLHATGCKCQRCNQDPFYHPRTTITTPTVSRVYRLFARRANDCVSGNVASGRLEFAVAPAGVVDPMLIVLPRDPRQPPGACYYSSNCGVDYQQQAWVELQSGDSIYIAGERGPYFVHMYADDAGPFRQNSSVFRNWGPKRKLQGMVRKNLSNSGLRNFTSVPSANALLRPWK